MTLDSHINNNASGAKSGAASAPYSQGFSTLKPPLETSLITLPGLAQHQKHPVTLQSLKSNHKVLNLTPRVLVLSGDLQLSDELAAVSEELHLNLYSYWTLESFQNFSYWPQLSFIIVEKDLWLKLQQPYFKTLRNKLASFPITIIERALASQADHQQDAAFRAGATAADGKSEDVTLPVVELVAYNRQDLRGLIQRILAN